MAFAVVAQEDAVGRVHGELERVVHFLLAEDVGERGGGEFGERRVGGFDEGHRARCNSGLLRVGTSSARSSYLPSTSSDFPSPLKSP